MTYDDILTGFHEMIANSTAARKFLQVPNNLQDARRAIYDINVTEAAVPIASLTEGAAGSASFTIAGNQTAVFLPGTHVRLVDGATDLLTISSSSYADGETTVAVYEALSGSPVHARPQAPPRISAWIEDMRFTKQSQTIGDVLLSSATYCMLLEWEPGPTYFDKTVCLDDRQGAGREFRRHIFAIRSQLECMAGTGSRPNGETWPDLGEFVETGPMEYLQETDNNGRPLWVCRLDSRFASGA